MVDIDQFEWAGPPTTTQRAHTLKGHLEDGGSAFFFCGAKTARPRVLRAKPDSNRLAWSSQGRFWRLPANGRTLCLHLSKPLSGNWAVYLLRARESPRCNTDCPMITFPIGGYSLAEPQQPTAGPAPPSLWNGGGLLASVIFRPVVLANVCIWLYNFLLDVSFAAGRWLIRAPLLKFAWARPVSKIPILLGFVTLGLAYYDWAMSDVACLLINGIANAPVWSTGHDAAYFGDKNGGISATTSAAYADFLGLM